MSRITLKLSANNELRFGVESDIVSATGKKELSVGEKTRNSFLTLPKNFNTAPKPKWGRDFRAKSFTARAKHTILEAGAWVDANKPRAGTFELTLTLPGDTQEAKRGIANWSGWIVNRLQQVVRRAPNCERNHIFFVWEFQKRKALHMHWAISCDSFQEGFSLSQELRCKFYQLMDELGLKLGIDFYQNRHGVSWKNQPEKLQWNVAPVYKSLAAYYSKYLGKTARNLSKTARWKSAQVYYPSRWWGCDRKLLREIKKCRISVEVPFLSSQEVAGASALLSARFSKRMLISKEYSYEYCVRSHPKAVPFASGKIRVIYSVLSQFGPLSLCMHIAVKILRLLQHESPVCASDTKLVLTTSFELSVFTNLLQTSNADMVKLMSALDVIADIQRRHEYICNWMSAIQSSGPPPNT